MTIDEILNNDNKFKYMLLGRLLRDCKYFIDNPSIKHLWAGNISEQIETMKALYNSFDITDKPTWINLLIIDTYNNRMIKAYRDFTTPCINCNR